MAKLDASNNPLTEDGTYTLPITPGQNYTLGAAGTWGSGSLAINWVDESGNVVEFDNSPMTANGAFVLCSPAGTMSLVLSGSAGASIRIQLAPMS